MKPEEFKAVRKKLQLTVNQLAEELDVSLASIGHWESGKRPLPERIVLRLTRLIKDNNPI